LIERLLTFFSIVEYREFDIDRPMSQVLVSIGRLSTREQKKLPWSDHFTWLPHERGFRILGQRDFHPFRIDGELQEVGTQTHLSIRTSYNEQMAKFLISVPAIVTFMIWYSFLSSGQFDSFDSSKAIMAALSFVCIAIVFPALILFVIGIFAGRRRPEDLSTVVSELYG
jgi:hypothetical protein